MLSSLTDLTYLPEQLKADLGLLGGRYLREAMTKLSKARTADISLIEF